ncbi:MAG: phosphoenolpyruvate carboxykinase (ATP) [Chloroflexi bacterium]|nr:phosphoenolpyruvate carboxykinase (ATP) [Chloroflexota bacterium]
MQLQDPPLTDTGLQALGLTNLRNIYWNLPVAALYEIALRNGEGQLASTGALVVDTGEHTGRSPKDKFIVREPSTEAEIDWRANRPFDPERFDALLGRVLAYLQHRDVYVLDCYAGADPKYRLPVRVITEIAWHNLFARQLFIPSSARSEPLNEPAENRFTVLSVPNFFADPERDGTRSGTFIILNFARRLILIGGTSYAGEIKKSIFTALNFLLPAQGIFPMHCSANIGRQGDVAIMFGLSGTGKTTLSADPNRALIGDDEHGWSDDGIFNFEGGCYAKVINLSPEAEPQIYAAINRFGAVLENVVIDPESHEMQLADASKTENTRAAYPLSFIPNIEPSGMGGHPRTIIFLTADAFGVLPPIARLTPSQAMYHFLSGYTARVAGTEKGVTDPEATFSTCFGAPFMVREPAVYARQLGEKIARHGSRVWLLNTGWQGGPYGVGKRISISHTRLLLNAALSGKLDNIPTQPHPIFGVHVPTECEGLPSKLLDPRQNWPDPAAYDAQARRLARMFMENFQRYAGTTTEEVRNAGPRL